MRFTATEIPEVLLIEPDVFPDARGFFLETYHAGKYREGGIAAEFVQDNHSFSSARGTLRGLHGQLRFPQGKLVLALSGEIWDVAVDLRPGSPTFKRWVARTLSGENHHQLYLPPGFVHGFCVTSEPAHVLYKCTEIYRRDDEIAVVWNDPELAIPWPLAAPLLNDKDRAAPRLAEILHQLEPWRQG
jgi:dTDP-4-dehydrorhamnose 3,5-epimerase